MTTLTELEKHDYKAATEWADSKFRGKTVYEGHPIQVIGDALAAMPNALRVIAECKAALDGLFSFHNSNGEMHNATDRALQALALIAAFDQDVTQQEK